MQVVGAQRDMDIQISGVAKFSPQFRGPLQQMAAIGERATRAAADPAANAARDTTASAAAAASESSSSTSQPADGTSTNTGAAAKLRFPWLSRISSELEPVAKQKPPFKTLPIIGDNVDHAA